MEPIETIEKNGLTIKILFDECPESPRKWDNIGTIYWIRKNYRTAIGDYSSIEAANTQFIKSLEIIKEYEEDHKDTVSEAPQYYNEAKEYLDTIIYLPLWDVQGTIRTSGYERYTPEGYICAIKGVEGLADGAIKALLEGEISTYNQYLSGDVYGYNITCGNKLLDSCYGYYSLNDCRAEALAIIDPLTDQLILSAIPVKII